MDAAIYCRVSTEEQAKEGFSIAAQKKTLLSYAEIRNWNVIKIYVDEGLSGKNTRRPAFQEVLSDASQKKFQLVLVWKINRFSRKNSDLLNNVEYLQKFGVNLVSFSEQFDASTPSGKLMLSMLGSIGEFERDTIIENIRAGMSERAEQGLFNGGRVLGYDSINGKLIINETEALIVKKIYELYIQGLNFNKIAQFLNSSGFKTKNGFNFSINSIKRILTNPIYIGYITYNKTRKTDLTVQKNNRYIKAHGKHEPIIPINDFELVQSFILSKSIHNKGIKIGDMRYSDNNIKNNINTGDR